MMSVQQYISYFNILVCYFNLKLKKIMMEEDNKNKTMIPKK